MPPRTPLGEIARKAFELAKLKPSLGHIQGRAAWTALVASSSV